MLVSVAVGDALFKAPGIMIGNPMGRLALAVTTIRDTLTFEGRGNLGDEGWGALAKAGWKRKEVVGCEVYVGNYRGHSFVACASCLDSLPSLISRIGFEPAKDKTK